MPRPVHFEIQAADPKRAIAFYSALFGWSFNKWEGPQDYWLIKTGEKDTVGIDGGMLDDQAMGLGVLGHARPDPSSADAPPRSSRVRRAS